MSDAWWESFFDDRFADMVLSPEADPTLDATLSFFEARLGQHRPALTWLDQCCGIGRHSLGLSARGHTVYGVDQSARYIERAQTSARARGLACAFTADDATTYQPPTPCDVVINWHTSFGYTLDDALNQRMIARAYDALRPGGRFALDYGNIAGILHRFQPVMVTRREEEAGEVILLREAQVDLVAGALRQRWSVMAPDGTRQTHQTHTRLYWPHELAAMCRAAGFSEVELLGGVDSSPLTPSSPRCIVIATR